ncbi:MAG: hypothetical protein B6227_03605 [Fusobacteriia bacterium 4572_74]|nr:MAG: hypothetical protein B6227_03605 [Fusobacteriia bacterium 4572_74]
MGKNNHSERSKIFFDKAANTNYGNSEKLDKYILKNIVIDDKTTILDLGCGDGRFLQKLRGLNSNNILYGLDISDKMLELADSKNIKKCGFTLGDSSYLPYSEGSIDLIVCLNSFHHYSTPELTLKGIKRVLSSEGRVIIGDIFTLPIITEIINLYLPYSKSGDYKMYSKRSLDKLFNTEGFKNQKFSIISPWLFVSEYKIKKSSN